MKTKEINTQLEKEISAVYTVLDVSRLLISASKDREDEKAKLTMVLEAIYSGYIAKLISKEALEIAVRTEPHDPIRKQIAERAAKNIGEIEGYLKEKGIIK